MRRTHFLGLPELPETSLSGAETVQLHRKPAAETGCAVEIRLKPRVWLRPRPLPLTKTEDKRNHIKPK